MGYNVQTELTVKDNATRTLNLMIGTIERADKALAAFQANLTKVGTEMAALENMARGMSNVMARMTGSMERFGTGSNSAVQGMRMFAAEAKASAANIAALSANMGRLQQQAHNTNVATKKRPDNTGEAAWPLFGPSRFPDP